MSARWSGLLAVFLAALALRGAFGLTRGPDLVWPDAQEYDAIARRLVAEGVYREDSGRQASRAPGYPVFLAACRAAGLGDPRAVYLLHALAGAAACVLAAQLGRRLFDERTGLLAGWIAALDPLAVYFSGTLLAETLFTLGLTGYLLLWLKLIEAGDFRRGWGWAVAAGALAGALTLLRSSFMLLPVFILPFAAWTWAAYRRTADDRRRTRDGGRQTTDDRRRTTDDGRGTADDRRRTTDDGRQTTDDRPRTTDHGRRTVDNGRRTADDGQQTADDERGTADNRRGTADNRRGTADDGRDAVCGTAAPGCAKDHTPASAGEGACATHGSPRRPPTELQRARYERDNSGISLLHCVMLWGVMMGVTALMLAPWTVRNYRIFGRVIPTTLQVGESLYEALSPYADGGPAMDRIDWPAVRGGPMGELENNDFFRKAALDYARERPARVVELAIEKARRFWNIVPNHGPHRTALYAAISVIAVLPVYLLALVAVARRRGAAFGLLAAPVVYFALMHVVFVGSVRYRVPVMPFVGILAAAGALWLWRRRAPDGGSQV